jgi:hypothetical protein
MTFKEHLNEQIGLMYGMDFEEEEEEEKEVDEDIINLNRGER